MSVNAHDFAKPEILDIIRNLNKVMDGYNVVDCMPALAVISAFCIDSHLKKDKARAKMIEMIDWVLSHAKEVGEMDEVHKVLGQDYIRE